MMDLGRSNVIPSLLAAVMVVAASAPALGADRKSKDAKPTMEELLEKGVEGKILKGTSAAPRGAKEQAKLLLPAVQQQVAKKMKGTHLRLVLRVTDAGETEVLSATEVPWKAKVPTVPRSDYLYEVTDGSKALVAEALPSDPFEIHAFGGKGKESRHYFSRQTEATIAVTVPKKNLSENLDGLGVQLYKLKEGPALSRVDKFEMSKLKSQGRLKPIARFESGELGAKIKEKSLKLELRDGKNFIPSSPGLTKVLEAANLPGSVAPKVEPETPTKKLPSKKLEPLRKDPLRTW